ERHLGLSGNRPREQRLPRSRRAAQEDAVWNPAAEPAVLVGMAEKVDDLGQLLLRLVDPGDVREGDLLPARLVAPGARAAEGAKQVLHVPCPSRGPDDQRYEQDRRAEADEEVLPPGETLIERFRIDHDSLVLQQLSERVGVC